MKIIDNYMEWGGEDKKGMCKKNTHFLLMKIVTGAGGLSACIPWNTLKSNSFVRG